MGGPEDRRDLESNGENVSARRSWAIISTWCMIGYLCLITIFLNAANAASGSILPLQFFSLYLKQGKAPFLAYSQGPAHFDKPKGFKIIALVPFHNHKRTSILECYLLKNLAQNHGLLDEVVFIPQTDDSTSLQWLDDVVKEAPAYTISHSNDSLWESNRSDTMYIQIDGDVVFLEDDVIPTIVKTKIEHRDSLIVSANVVNEAALATLHSHPSVTLPYLPELRRVRQSARSASQIHNDWRVSSLPSWEGPADFKMDMSFTAPFDGHRWLLSRGGEADKTPISASVYADDGPGLAHWTVSAQSHYSFLHHLERGDLYRYKFPLWVDPAEPVSQNFFCFWGATDITSVRRTMQTAGIPHDSFSSAVQGTNQKPHHVIIDGKGLVAHYPSDAGKAGLDSADLLQRYQAYADEMICPRS